MDLVRYRCGLGSRGMLTLLVCRYRSDGCIHRGRCLGTFAAWPKGNMGAARGLHPRDVTYHDGVGLAAGRLVFGTISGPVLDSPPVSVPEVWTLWTDDWLLAASWQMC